PVTRPATATPCPYTTLFRSHQTDLLGLSGEVTTEQLESLLEGRDPTTGTQLGYPLVDRVEKSGKVRKAVAGFDATFSAPKSLSRSEEHTSELQSRENVVCRL